jgi:hypothetical protein
MKLSSSGLLLVGAFGLIICLVMLFTGPQAIQSLYQRPKSLENQTSSSGSDIKSTYEINGQQGDAFGGTVGPIVAMFAAILTFLAFWAQYEANLQQRKDIEIERFENRFYELVRIHRENVSDVVIADKIRSKKAFIQMFYELKFIYHATQEHHDKNYKAIYEPLEPEVIYNISYLVFFFGIGPNSSQMVSDLLGDKYTGFFDTLQLYLRDYQKKWEQKKKNRLPLEISTPNGIFPLSLSYKPADGHMSRLSHYVRNLFQLVKYIEDANSKVFDYEAKYNYATTVRSQLSPHEQLLLFYNALSILGRPWLTKPQYMKNYCMVKSVPLSLADFYKSPLEELGERNEKGKPLFEWNEIKYRMEMIGT